MEREGIDVATIGAGDFFGEIALLEDDRRTATVASATRVRAAVMSAADFFEMCAEIPQIGQRVSAAALERGAALAALAEERAQQLPAGLGLDAAVQLDAMVQTLVLHEVAERSGEPGLRIGRAEHHAVDAREHDRRPRTSRTAPA